jgi:NAD(P)-dependent dehydrogenase (short-subunit alcohol dehydrogenase family)
MTIGLAKEVAAEGIRVNAVRPGLIDTEIHASSGIADRVARLAGNVPMQRGGRADEVAEAILWLEREPTGELRPIVTGHPSGMKRSAATYPLGALASDAASYVTGTLLDCAGGR